MRGRVGLECSECGQRNYSLKKSADALASIKTLKKYCPKCRVHTEHHLSK